MGEKLKPYPDFACEKCLSNSGAPLLPSRFERGGRFCDADETACGVCGATHVPLSEPSDNGYPVFEGHVQPEWDWIDPLEGSEDE